MQKHLLYITKLVVSENLETSKLREVTAEWREKDHTACLSFYFHGPITDEEIDEASDLSGGIMAHFADALLEEHYVRLDYPQSLPDSNVAYIHK